MPIPPEVEARIKQVEKALEKAEKKRQDQDTTEERMRVLGRQKGIVRR